MYPSANRLRFAVKAAILVFAVGLFNNTNASDDVNTKEGLIVTYSKGLWKNLPGLGTIPHYSTAVVSDINYSSTGSYFATSGQKDKVGARFEGLINIETAGSYTFYLTSDDGSRLFIDGSRVINNDGLHSMRMKQCSLELTAGKHSIAVDFFERYGGAGVILEWLPPGGDRAPVPAALFSHSDTQFTVLKQADDTDGDGLTDTAESELGTNPLKADSDGEGLDDKREVELGTNPLVADTDGDSVSDYEEVVLAHTNPLVADFDGSSPIQVTEVSGDQFRPEQGTWRVDNGEIVSSGLRGSVTAGFSLENAGIYRVRLKYKRTINKTAVYNLVCKIDGFEVSRRSVTLYSSSMQTLTFYSPYLLDGSHQLQVEWDNGYRTSTLAIAGVSFECLAGSDTDGDGQYDWVQNRLNATCSVDARDLISKVSPVCLQGSALYPELVTVSAFTDGVLPVDLAVRQSVLGQWYAAADLVPGKETEASVSFENGAKQTTLKYRWVETNLISDGGTITVKPNDSLLLTAHGGDKRQGHFIISALGQEYRGKCKGAVQVSFPTVGQFTIDGSYEGPHGDSDSGSLTVNVVDYDFGNTAYAFLVGKSRTVKYPLIPDTVSIGCDAQSDIGLAGSDGTASKVQLKVPDNRARTLSASMLTGGAVLDTVPIQGLYVAGAGDAPLVVLEKYDDGTVLIEQTMISSPVIPDVELEIKIFLSGVVFEDGTTTKRLTAGDFNSLGEARIRYVRTPKAWKTATCHHVKAYQNGEKVGDVY